MSKRAAATATPEPSENARYPGTSSKKQARSSTSTVSTLSPEDEPVDYEAGIIRTIIVENFMNHSHLRIDLDPHVNFIVGKNGSGKSAIVASCIAGLACKASSSGRNLSSYKSFIKHGEDYALIQIHLANPFLSDPYKHDEFGDTVIVEHRIEKNGAGSYRLKSGCGAADRKSNKKEVEELCEHFNIQCENPCALLTQEAAKKFLHNGTEDTRYKFFLEAANLQSRRVHLLGTQTHAEESKVKTEKAKARMPEFEEMARNAKEAFDGATYLKKLEQQKTSMEPMVAWAQVAFKEREMTNLEAEAKAADEGFGKAADKVDKAARDLQQLEQSRDTAEGAHADIVQALEQTTQEVQRLKDAAKVPQKAAKDAKRTVDAARADRLEAEQELQGARATLAELESTLEERQQALHAVRDHKKKQLEEQKANATKTFDELKKQAGELKAGNEGYAGRVAHVQQQLDQAKESVQRGKEGLKEVTTRNSGVLQNIHPQMPELVETLRAKAREFADKVCGPLGAHVKLKDEFGALAIAAECALRGSQGLASFAVSSKEDEKLLRRVASGLKPPPKNVRPLADLLGVLIRPREARFEQPPQLRLVSDHPTLHDAVTIDDADMHNLFLDRYDGGQILLFADQQTAQAALFDKRKGAPKLANGSFMNQLQGIANDNTKHKFVVYKGGTQVKDWIGHAPKGILIADQGARRQLLQQQVQQSQRAVTDTEEHLKEVEHEWRQAHEQEKRLQKEQKVANDSYRQAHNALKGLESSDADEAMHDLEHAEQEVSGLQRRIEQATASEQTSQQDHARATAEYQPQKERFDEMKAKVIALQDEEKVKKDEMHAFDPQMRKLKLEQRRLEKDLESAKQGGEQKRADAREIQTYLHKITPKVRAQFGDRVDDPDQRSVEKLKEDFTQLDRKLKAAEKKHGGKNLRELEELALSTAKKLHEKADELTICENQTKAVHDNFKTRYKLFKKTCNNKGTQASSDFNTRLSKKQHAGTLVFDHAEERLSLEVSRNSQDAQLQATSDARNLSGGERSFTTLAFELAMWEFCETPFRVLDEFDVYMDDTYRKIAVDTLMELCESQPRRQFLFITPQDMYPFLKDRPSSSYRIVRMSDVRPS